MLEEGWRSNWTPHHQRGQVLWWNQVADLLISSSHVLWIKILFKLVGEVFLEIVRVKLTTRWSVDQLQTKSVSWSNFATLRARLSFPKTSRFPVQLIFSFSGLSRPSMRLRQKELGLRRHWNTGNRRWAVSKRLSYWGLRFAKSMAYKICIHQNKRRHFYDLISSSGWLPDITTSHYSVTSSFGLWDEQSSLKVAMEDASTTFDLLLN